MLEDIDPAVCDANPPFVALIGRLWERPHMRADFVFAWRAARNDGRDAGSKWHWVRGPVGAAWATMKRLKVQWPAPFVVTLLGSEVNLLEVPPAQVKEILMAHARWRTDLDLIDKLVESATSWGGTIIRDRYQRSLPARRGLGPSARAYQWQTGKAASC